MSSTSRPPVSKQTRWFFTNDQILDTPSKKDGIERYDELRYRQNAANLIQDCGKRLNVPQLTINTAIVFMHRFFMLHSFQKYDKYDIAAASLFLAAKVEENPRKVEHVLKTREEWGSKNGSTDFDIKSEEYQRKLNRLVDHELLLLQTFGFDISIDHPHKHVIRATQFMRAPLELSKVAYFMATNSLLITTFCLEMRSEIVAATCIYLAFKWSEFEVGLSTDGREWWSYLDQNLTEDTLVENVKTYIKILQEHPARMADMKKMSEKSKPLQRNTTSTNGQGQGQFRNSSQKRSKPDDLEVQEPQKRIRNETEKPTPELPPIRPPTNHSHRDRSDRKKEVDNGFNQSITPSEDGRPNSFMPKLRKDFNFVKDCLRNRDLWCKLSDEEKEFCKREKEKNRQNRQKHKIKEARGPPAPSETQAATESLLAEFE